MSLIFSEGGAGGVTPEELQAAVDELQDQIDTISAASDCTDIVGTYTDLQNYDTSKLTDNDIIKVLNDTTHDGQPSYYRWSTSTEQFTYIGSEPRVNDGMLTIKYDEETVGTFSANQSTNNTVTIPTTDLSALATKTELTDGLAEKQDAFTADAPLVKSVVNPYGIFLPMTYNSSLDQYYSSANAAYPQIYNNNNYLINFNFNPTTTNFLTNLNQQNSGYAILPYTLGDIIGYCTSCSRYTTSGIHYGVCCKGWLGIVKDGDFRPVIPLMSTDDRTYIEILTGDLTLSGSNIKADNRTSLVADKTTGFSGFWGSNQKFVQILPDDNNYKITFIGNDTKLTTTIVGTSSEASNLLSQVNAVLFPCGYSKSGYIGYSGQPYEFATGTDNYCGTSESFDLSQINTQADFDTLGNYFSNETNTLDPNNLVGIKTLSLNIGTGLAVRDGNLVNTNPTPVTVDQTYDAASANAQSGVAVGSVISTVSAELAKKQDAFEIDTPLAMNAISYAYNMAVDGNAVYAQTGNGYIIPYENAIYASASSSSTTLDDIFATGYIDMPMAGGDTVTCNDDYLNTTLGCVLGEGFGSDFKPLVTFRGNYTAINSLGLCDGTYTISSDRATLNLAATLTDGSLKGWTDSTSKVNAFQIIKDSSGYIVNVRWRYGATRVGLLRYIISNATQKAILDRVNCCRVFPLVDTGQTSSAPLRAAKFGVYNVGSNIDNTTIFSNNLISVEDLINGVNHLQLSIGTGLTIESNSLTTNIKESDIYYKAGDSVTFASTQDVWGYAASTFFQVTIPLPKRLDKITNVAVNRMDVANLDVSPYGSIFSAQNIQTLGTFLILNTHGNCITLRFSPDDISSYSAWAGLTGDMPCLVRIQANTQFIFS